MSSAARRRRGDRPAQRAVLRAAHGLGLFACLACDHSGSPVTVATPPAELYDAPIEFAGTWRGESDEGMGKLEIRKLGNLRYYGRFAADDGLHTYVANMSQETVLQEDARQPANVLSFTWQDGRGGVGKGWLMIDQDSAALTGELVYGDSQRRGSLAFVREGELSAVQASPTVQARPAEGS
ncbi:MAG: hypothetical protein R3A79_00140 [Nannocystaceae bacterium]